MLGAADVVVLKQWAVERLVHGLAGAVVTFGHGGTHDGYATVSHYGIDILEVNVYVAGHGDNFRDAFGGGGQDVVCFGESILKAEVAVDLAQFVVADYDEGVNVVFQFFEAFHSVGGAAATFEGEWEGDDPYRQDAHFAGGLGDDWGGAGTRSTTHSGGDEEHTAIVVEVFLYFLDAFFASGFPDVWFGSRSTPLRQIGAEVHKGWDGALLKRLVIGITDSEVDTDDALFVHVIHGIRAAATNADDFDDGRIALRKIDGHSIGFVPAGSVLTVFTPFRNW